MNGGQVAAEIINLFGWKLVKFAKEHAPQELGATGVADSFKAFAEAAFTEGKGIKHAIMKAGLDLDTEAPLRHVLESFKVGDVS